MGEYKFGAGLGRVSMQFEKTYSELTLLDLGFVIELYCEILNLHDKSCFYANLRGHGF